MHSNTHVSVQNERYQLGEVHERLAANPTDPSLILEEKEASKKLKGALLEEKIVVRKKLRVKWLELGDGNTRLFFNQVKENCNYNKILDLENNNGDIVFGQAFVFTMILNFFKNSIGTVLHVKPCDLNSSITST